MWGAVEKDTNLTACNMKVQMTDRIKEALEVLPQDTVKTACARFRGWVEAMEDTDGGFFE